MNADKKDKWAVSKIICKDCKIVTEENAQYVCGNCMRILALFPPPQGEKMRRLLGHTPRSLSTKRKK